MIKGKWRIDLGGKIKGAKSVALGSAVTKRGQDNSLQMCERCKYQAGGGAAARRAMGGRDGGWAAPRGPWTLGRLPRTAGPSPVGIPRGRETGVSGNPRLQAGASFLGRSGFVSGAQLCWPGAALQVPFPPAGDPRWRVQMPPESLRAPPHQAFPAAPGPASRTPLCSAPSPAPGPPRPAVQARAPRPAPLLGRAGGGGGSLRSGSLWRRCVRRSLCRGAGSRGNANEANPGRRAEEPAGDGREGARRGDGCLPRGREEGLMGAPGAGCGPMGAALWAGRAGTGPRGVCAGWGWGAVGTVGP